MRSRPVIAAIGEVLWDVYPDAARFGGAPANFACHAAAFGADALLVSAVGNDEAGDRAMATLERHHVDTTSVVRDPAHATGKVDVTVDASGQASYQFADDVAWDHLSWADSLALLAQQLDAICYGTLAQRSKESRETIHRLVGATLPGTMRMFDVNLRQAFFTTEVIDASLRLATALKLNEEELAIVAELCGVAGSVNQEVMRALLDRYELSIVALTCGPNGAVLMTADDVSECPAVPTQIVDTVGAGDAFTAALVIDFMRGLPLGEINRHANMVAAFVCSQAGAVAPLPAGLLQP
ncbi:MAG TPA: carbohydrate kinase [Gemmatimonadaceae bacterium]|nr:carbohydrate kinase [Gemmatimonadaceae bacterium]